MLENKTKERDRSYRCRLVKKTQDMMDRIGVVYIKQNKRQDGSYRCRLC